MRALNTAALSVSCFVCLLVCSVGVGRVHRTAHFKAVNLETRSGQCTLQFSPTDGPDWLMSPRCKHRHAALADSFSHSIFQPFDSAAAAAAGTDRGFVFDVFVPRHSFS
jgi:hypothetical protein